MNLKNVLVFSSGVASTIALSIVGTFVMAKKHPDFYEQSVDVYRPKN